MLAVSGALFERLDSGGAQVAQPLLERVGALCAEAAEAEAERDEGEAAAPYESAAAAAMGAAIQHLGPQQVLGICPLNIAEVLSPPRYPSQDTAGWSILRTQCVKWSLGSTRWAHSLRSAAFVNIVLWCVQHPGLIYGMNKAGAGGARQGQDLAAASAQAVRSQLPADVLVHGVAPAGTPHGWPGCREQR